MSRRTKFVILFFVLTICLLIRGQQNSTVKYNYLYMNALNFHGHEIEDAVLSRKNILALGNSAVAGNNIPADSTVTAHFNRLATSDSLKMYNLGSLEQSLLESLIYLKISPVKNPELVVLGLNPASFFIGGGEDLTIANEEVLKILLSPEVFSSIVKDNRRKQDPWPKFKKKFGTIIPSPFQLWFSERVLRIKWSIFGKLYSAQIAPGKNIDVAKLLSANSHGDRILKSFGDLARSMGSRPVVYLTPIHDLNKIYNPTAYSSFKASLIRILKQENILYFDYDSLLPFSHDYFVDYIHSTSLGNEIVAKKLLEDLRSNGLI